MNCEVRKNWKTSNGALSSALFCTLMIMTEQSYEANNAETEQHRENRVNFQHLLMLGNSGGGGNERSQSSRLMLLILMWSHANLTIILWDILSEGQTLSAWEFPHWPCRNKRTKQVVSFQGNHHVNVLFISIVSCKHDPKWGKLKDSVRI